MPPSLPADSPAPPALCAALGDEGFRLFFPLAALHVGLWPLIWAGLGGYDLPVGGPLAPALWHGQEMLIGGYGAALLGFLTTAVPEWTLTPRLRGRGLFVLAGLWGLGRLGGASGSPALAALALIADAGWLLGLCAYLIRIAWGRSGARLGGFLVWVAGLTAAVIAARLGLVLGEAALAERGMRAAGLCFLGLLGLALARIVPAVTNRVLDPSGRDTPFRPHPGRRHLAPGLTALVLAGDLAGLSAMAQGFLLIAAGAAFLDRVAEGFVGRDGLRAELLALGGAAALGGAGLILLGAAGLGAAIAPSAGLHLAFMGGLGLGVMVVLAIAGWMHSGGDLPLPRAARLALGTGTLAVLVRVAPELDLLPALPVSHHLLAAGLWALAHGVWLISYWPRLRRLA